MGRISEVSDSDSVMKPDVMVKTERGSSDNNTTIKVGAIPIRPVYSGRLLFSSGIKRRRPDPDDSDSEHSDDDSNANIDDEDDDETLDADSNINPPSSHLGTPINVHKRACTIVEKGRKAHNSFNASYTEMTNILNLTKELKEECERAEEVAEREKKAKAGVQRELRESIVRADTLEGKVGILKGELQIGKEKVKTLEEGHVKLINDKLSLEAEVKKGYKKVIMALEDKLKRIEREHEITKKRLTEEIDKSKDDRGKHLYDESIWLIEKGKYQGDLLERDKEINRLKVELEKANNNDD